VNDALHGEFAPVAPAGEGLEVVFAADLKVYDGSYVNNGWLQELPDPITRLTWDNAAFLSPATAGRHGLETGSMAKIEVDGRALEIPVLVAPGHADDSVTIPLGYGRKRSGHVGNGTGFNGYVLRTSRTPLFATGAVIGSVGRKHDLAVTHGHWTMEGRDFFREGTIEDYRHDPQFARTIGMDSHIPPNVSLYRRPPLDAAEQWGMTIDLNTCTGCSACVIACQSENNIPIVGKEQVVNQREMHWMRIDRYFASVEEDEPNPEMVMQPVNCQHCENAPCETVCPVNATVHSEDGLNVMAYNRCIGTRYCANNCPYKVRRFNFFDYNQRPLDDLYWGPLAPKGTDELIKMSKNPNVTVRMRGVMEKCTFCLQRIEAARIDSRIEADGSGGAAMPTDAVKTACQQACPADAITFGDISDEKSRVAREMDSDRSYRILEYLNVKPRVSYLARLRNPNTRMPGAEKSGRINSSAGHGKGHGEKAGHGSDSHGADSHGSGTRVTPDTH
jgi:molybdopterin-containing oxidoreductase family iron-sulfur binding subunit